MTPRQYLRYTDELKANGYEYRENCPYDGRNLWLKEPDGRVGNFIKIEVYHGLYPDGEEYYQARPFVIMERKDCCCEVHLSILFDTINIVDIESMFEKYVRMMDGGIEFVKAK